jgi:Alpha-L-arabinofuranosidase B (ABFB) domain
MEPTDPTQEVAEAARWLDPDDRVLLSLWSQEVGGRISRAEIAAANDRTVAHTGLRLRQLRDHLETSRTIVAALDAEPLCPRLGSAIVDWDGAPSPAWRQRLARHTRTCPACTAAAAGRVPLERLLATAAPVALSPALPSTLAVTAAGEPGGPQSSTGPGTGGRRARIGALARSTSVRLAAGAVAATILVTVGLVYAVFRQLPDSQPTAVVPLFRAVPSAVVTVPVGDPTGTASPPPLPPPATTIRPTPSARPSARPRPSARAPRTTPPAPDPAPTRTAPTGTVPVGEHSLELVSGSAGSGGFLSYSGDRATLATLASVSRSDGSNARRGATFTVVPGRADPDCVTFRAADGRYLRHSQWQLVLSQDDGSGLFREDATFCPQPGSISGSASLRSYNYPLLSLHHPDAHFWLQNPDGSAAAGPISSFIVRPALSS